MAGILDTARFATFIAWEIGASVKDVTAVVLGGHGDQMVSVVSATTVGGVPLRKLVSDDRISELVARTAGGGGELVKLLGTSAWYAPGAASAQMVDSIVLDEKRVLPCTAYLEGEYGIQDLYMGVPVKLGADGIEEIVELELVRGRAAAPRRVRRRRPRGRRRALELGKCLSRQFHPGPWRLQSGASLEPQAAAISPRSGRALSPHPGLLFARQTRGDIT